MNSKVKEIINEFVSLFNEPTYNLIQSLNNIRNKTYDLQDKYPTYSKVYTIQLTEVLIYYLQHIDSVYITNSILARNLYLEYVDTMDRAGLTLYLGHPIHDRCSLMSMTVNKKIGRPYTPFEPIADIANNYVEYLYADYLGPKRLQPCELRYILGHSYDSKTYDAFTTAIDNARKHLITNNN